MQHAPTSPADLASVFDRFPRAAVATDLHRTITYANRPALSLFSPADGQLVGKSARCLYTSDEAFEAQGHARYRIGLNERDDTYRVHYRRGDGGTFLANTTAGQLVDGAGETVGFYGIVEPATRSEQSLDTLQRLHALSADGSMDFEERVGRMLALGAEHFDLPLGIVSRVEGDLYTVEHVRDPAGALQVGTTFDVGGTYCSHTLAADAPVGFHHAGQSEIRSHPCYLAFQLESYLGCPIQVDGETYGTLNFSRPAPSRPFTADDRALIGLIAQWIGHGLTQRRSRQALERLASVDDLSGVLNRRAWMGGLSRQLAQARRSGGPVTVILLDVDHFKQINDTFGHGVGDQVLQALGERCRAVSRETDLVGRVGGEEFALVLPHTNLEGAHTLGQRLGESLRRAAVSTPSGAVVMFTVSMGIAEVAPGEAAQEVLRRADLAMYAAKAAGRDRIRLAS